MLLTGQEILDRRHKWLDDNTIMTDPKMRGFSAEMRTKREAIVDLLTNPNTALITLCGNYSLEEILLSGRARLGDTDTPCVLIKQSLKQHSPLVEMDLNDAAYGGKWYKADWIRDGHTDSDCTPYVYQYEKLAERVKGPQKNILDGVNKRYKGVAVQTQLNHDFEATDFYGWALVANVGSFHMWTSTACLVMMNLDNGEFKLKSLEVSSPRWSSTMVKVSDGRLAEAFGKPRTLDSGPSEGQKLRNWDVQVIVPNSTEKCSLRAKVLFKDQVLDVANQPMNSVAVKNMKVLIDTYCSKAPPDGGMTQRAKVFISHSTRDGSKTAFRDCFVALNTSNIPVFNPLEDFVGQQATVEKMEEFVAKSPLLIACLSPEFFRSKFCFAEVNAAAKHGIPVVPVVAGEEFPQMTWNEWIAGDLVKLLAEK